MFCAHLDVMYMSSTGIGVAKRHPVFNEKAVLPVLDKTSLF